MSDCGAPSPSLLGRGAAPPEWPPARAPVDSAVGRVHCGLLRQPRSRASVTRQCLNSLICQAQRGLISRGGIFLTATLAANRTVEFYVAGGAFPPHKYRINQQLYNLGCSCQPPATHYLVTQHSSTISSIC